MAGDPALVDTSCWIEFFNRPETEVAASVRVLIEEDRAAISGIVLAELSQGARTSEELDELRAALGAVMWASSDRSVYARAGALGFELRRLGLTVPVTDCVIAATAETIGGRVLTLDSHFQELTKVASITVSA